jgi:hypothetical protein
LFEYSAEGATQFLDEDEYSAHHNQGSGYPVLNVLKPDELSPFITEQWRSDVKIDS